MLVHRDHPSSTRDFSITATALPVGPATIAAGDRFHPVVAVFGHPGRVAGLEQHLPGGWSLRRPPGFDDVARAEIVLLTGVGVEEVAAARAVLPSLTLIVAVVDQDARAEVVADVLTAGADVCVRGGQPAVLAGHLVACRRRQVADRWARVSAPTVRV